MDVEKKNHWEKIYSTKKPNEVSWTQEIPEMSLHLIRSTNLPKSASIIDIGGGDSKLVDFLLQEGYENISVLDISEQAIQRAKNRLGTKSEQIKWIVSDIIDFNPVQQYDLWHDRATFHFLTKEEQVARYVGLAEKAVAGSMIIATFSDKGPDKCSGLEIKKYSERQLSDLFSKSFNSIKCLTDDHITPFHTIQNFTFCSFKKK